MRYMKKTVAVLAAVIMAVSATACGRDESSLEQPPEISLPDSTSAVTQQTTTAKAETSEVSLPDADTADAVREETADTTEQVTQEVTAESTEQTEEPLDPMDYGAYLLTDAEMEFTENCIFVGDSICRGFGTYKVLSFANVYANGSMGTRNFYEYTFTYGRKNEELQFTELLHRTQPHIVFLSMGMNDINMIHPSEYRANYERIVDDVLRETDAIVYLCGMTPVRSNFTSNERIDYFNAELKALADMLEEVYYVEYGQHMLNDRGVLNNQLDGGDGVHLSPYAYRIALWEIRRTLIEDGTLDYDPDAVQEEYPTYESVSSSESDEVYIYESGEDFSEEYYAHTEDATEDADISAGGTPVV